MEFSQAKKKKLDFEGNSFNVPNMATRFTSEGFGDDEESSRDSEESISSATSIKSQETVNVYLRLKPDVKLIPSIYSVDYKSVILRSQNAVERQYTFTSVLDQKTDQKTLYDTCIRKVMTNPLHEAGAVFASYGVSNSGKTFTILGEKSAGIVPRALAQIFSEYKNQIAERPRVKVVNDTISILNDCEVKMEIGASMDYLQEARTVVKAKHPHQEPWMETEKILEEHSFAQKTTTHQQIFVWISFLEIYNEKIIDLFQPQKSSQENYTVKRALKIISNNHNSFVHGLTWLHVGSLGEALEILQAGVGRVNYAATGMNKHSSRSHTIFTINIIAENELDYELSSYKFCDLAGAERVSKTGNVGDRMKEAGGINSSLMVLRKCLETVQHNQRPGINKSIVPVRESKLTFLLQSSLMGREKFVMICNLLPTSDCFEENINVLHFGSITNKIITQKAEVKRYSKLNFSLTRDDSEFFDESDSVSILSTSYMPANELRLELRRKDIEIVMLRKAVQEAEVRIINQRQNILNEFRGNAVVKQESDQKFFEESQERLKIYYEKRMESMRITFAEKEKRLIREKEEENDFFQREIQKLKKKFGMKDDADIIDLDSSEDATLSGSEDISYANDEIEK